MEEKRIICVSVVVNFSNKTILLANSDSANDMLLTGIKKIDENAVQCVVRTTSGATGLIVKNPKEVARIRVKMQDEDESYKLRFFISTEFSGSFRNSSNADLAWPSRDEVKTAQEIYKTVMPCILSGKYVKGTYNVARGKFVSLDVTNEKNFCDE